MLSVSGPEKFYYLRNFHDLRCKYARVLSVIRQQMNREPLAGEAYIMMSKDRHAVRMYSYDKRSCRLYEQRFDKDYTFMKVSGTDGREVFSISWDDVVVLLGSPVVKTLRIREFGIRKSLEKLWEWNVFSIFKGENQQVT